MLVPTPPEPPASPRVKELGARVAELIRGFQREFPMTPAEIREAIRHASRSAAPTRFSRKAVATHVLYWALMIAIPVAITALIGLFR